MGPVMTSAEIAWAWGGVVNSIVWTRLFHAKCGKRMLVCVANDDKRKNCVGLEGGGREVNCVESVVSREVWETYACVCP